MDEKERTLLLAVEELLKLYVRDTGGCDHSVGICVCGDVRTLRLFTAWLHPERETQGEAVAATEIESIERISGPRWIEDGEIEPVMPVRLPDKGETFFHLADVELGSVIMSPPVADWDEPAYFLAQLRAVESASCGRNIHDDICHGAGCEQ
jgi:hypothetical protein